MPPSKDFRRAVRVGRIAAGAALPMAIAVALGVSLTPALSDAPGATSSGNAVLSPVPELLNTVGAPESASVPRALSGATTDAQPCGRRFRLRKFRERAPVRRRRPSRLRPPRNSPLRAGKPLTRPVRRTWPSGPLPRSGMASICSAARPTLAGAQLAESRDKQARLPRRDHAFCARPGTRRRRRCAARRAAARRGVDARSRAGAAGPAARADQRDHAARRAAPADRRPKRPRQRRLYGRSRTHANAWRRR